MGAEYIAQADMVEERDAQHELLEGREGAKEEEEEEGDECQGHEDEDPLQRDGIGCIRMPMGRIPHEWRSEG